MNEMKPALPRIMIVDDAPQNLKLLEAMLSSKGYQVFALPNGEMALKAAAKSPPDLILLDILMPGIDGYEVCARLKQDPQLREVPVLFLSALNEPLDKVRAFHLGGVDYITKPFQIEEVEARVSSHLELCRQKVALKRNLERQRELERLRDNLVHMVVHDMRSPMQVIVMTLEMVQKIVQEHDPDLQEFVIAAQQSAKQLLNMAGELLDISRLETDQMPLQYTTGSLVGLVRVVQESCAAMAEGKKLAVEPGEEITAVYDHDLIRRVLMNLINNALHFIPPDGEIRIGVSRDNRQILVKVADNGSGIPPEYHQKIFEKFGQVEKKGARYGTGLGLAFCKLAVEAHGGVIGVESNIGQGSTFWFTLPLVPGDRSKSPNP
jgi:two-component system, sensor histidine kinase and response regulator